MDNDLRKTISGNNTQLNPQHRRAFEEVIRSAAPFPRRFPTGKAMDEELGNILHDLPISAAQNLLDSAGENNLLSDEDRQLINELLQAIANGGPEATRSQKRGYFSIVNLTTAAAMLGGALFGSVVGDTAKEVDLYNRSITWMGENVELVLELAQDMPADVRATLESVIEELEANNDQPGDGVGEVTALDIRRRRKPKERY